MKQKLILAVSLLVGLLAFWLGHRYLSAERARLYAGAEQVQVLVAGRDLPAGAVLTFDDLAQRSEYRSAVGENVFRPEDLDRVLDKRLRYSLQRGEPLWWAYIDVGDEDLDGLSAMVKTGMRAISLPVGGEAAVSGFVRPNDRVDILGTFRLPGRGGEHELETVTLTVLQDVTILATGDRLDRRPAGSAAPGRGYSTVTVEVTPREAELLVFAQQVQGGLFLSLRNPDDVSFEADLPEVDFRRLEDSLPELNEYRQREIRHKREL